MTPFERFQTIVKDSADRLQIDSETREALLSPNEVHETSVEIESDTGETKTFTGYRVQFNNARGPYKGGIRFHQEADLDEVSALAGMMAIKTAVINVPLGGGKGGVTVNPKELSESEIEKVSRGWTRAMQSHIGVDIDIPAPDVNTNPQVMSWMLDEYEKLIGKSSPGVITGKPLELGGSRGRDTATAQGAVYIIEEWARNNQKNLKDLHVVVQGFGNAGYTAADILFNLGCKIVAVSDSRGAIHNDEGLNPADVMAHKNESGSVADYKSAENIPQASILTTECDILIPAALDGVITKENASDISAKLIIELANGPTTPEADAILDDANIIVVPDVLANAGGVTVSYFEWVQNRQQYYWKHDVVQERLREHMIDAYQQVLERANNESTTLRSAAYDLALTRITKAMKLRGHIS